MIDFAEYISEERKQEIAESVFRETCEQKFQSDDERIFSNAAYAAVWVVVDEIFDGKAAQMVAEKVPSIIDGLTEYSVFRSEGLGRGRSVAQKTLDDAIQENKDAINRAVRIAASKITRDYILDAVLDADFKVSIERS